MGQYDHSGKVLLHTVLLIKINLKWILHKVIITYGKYHLQGAIKDIL